MACVGGDAERRVAAFAGAASTVWMALSSTVPQAETMGVIGVLAFLANVLSAVILWRHREGDANCRSVWICSRNDAIGNVAVVIAALGVFGTGTGWPDFAVAAFMSALAISGGWQIVAQARRELLSIGSQLGQTRAR